MRHGQVVPALRVATMSRDSLLIGASMALLLVLSSAARVLAARVPPAARVLAARVPVVARVLARRRVLSRSMPAGRRLLTAARVLAMSGGCNSRPWSCPVHVARAPGRRMHAQLHGG